MLIGALGDIHGAFDTVQDIMARHADVPLWVSGRRRREQRRRVLHADARPVLDQGQQRGLRRDRGRDGRPFARADLHYLPNGGPHLVGPVARRRARRHVRAELVSHAGRGAAAVARAESDRASLKLGKSRDDKRRHFVRDEVLACKALTGIDIFLTHEAPRPFYPAGRRIDAGKTVINEVLTAMRPRLHLFGHHHEFTDSIRQGVRSIGLDVVTTSYLLVDAATSLRADRDVMFTGLGILVITDRFRDSRKSAWRRNPNDELARSGV